MLDTLEVMMLIVSAAKPVLPLFHILSPLHFVLAELIVIDIAGNVKHPRSEVTIAAKQMSVSQDSQKGVLHQVFAQLAIACQSVKETIQRSLVPLKKQAESVQVSIPDLDHNGIVGKRFQRVRRDFQEEKPRWR